MLHAKVIWTIRKAIEFPSKLGVSGSGNRKLKMSCSLSYSLVIMKHFPPAAKVCVLSQFSVSLSWGRRLKGGRKGIKDAHCWLNVLKVLFFLCQRWDLSPS
jgi:hypothetical protein